MKLIEQLPNDNNICFTGTAIFIPDWLAIVLGVVFVLLLIGVLVNFYFNFKYEVVEIDEETK